MVPSVTTMGGSRSFQTSRPLNAPSIPPASSVNSSTGTTPASGKARLKSAASMPHSARFAATDRSMPRTRMTSICPSASMMRIAVSSSSPARLRGAAKPGNATVTAASNASVSSANSRSRRATSDQLRSAPDIMRRSRRAAGFRCWPAARVNSPRSRPRRMTSTRSDMPRISGSSEEIRITPLPARANSLVTACTAALAPTSMPLVGSSRISTAGLRASHLAITTFC